MADVREMSLNPFDAVFDRVESGTRNALELLQAGRLGAPYEAPYDVVSSTDVFDLRRYHPGETSEEAPPVVFVPPLMVTSSIYDISPELSAVSFLAARDLDVWLVDYGSPESQHEGLERDLDDHVLAVDRAIDEIVERRGRPVHLVGYSQGGMFCYQAAAYRRSSDIASIVTFGSPVDIRRNFPVEVHDEVAERLLKIAHQGLSGPLEAIRGLPGEVTSSGFKLLNPGKELKHALGFLGSLHDRETLEEEAPKRRFLGGEGFVAWPGEALRDFIDDVVVDNRMASGGFVIDGRSVSLADVDSPILYFYGSRDDFAHEEAVRAIEGAAPAAEAQAVEVPAGHFGLVVGSTALGEVWPSVADWIAWREGDADRPIFGIEGEGEAEGEADGKLPEHTPEETERPSQALYEMATNVVDGVWNRLGDVSREVGDVVDTLRWQIPRLARIESLGENRRVNMGRALEEQARAIPEETFFLWEGQAFSYEAANRRVEHLASALRAEGIESGDHVGILMDNHPDYLSAVGAANRIGAVSVLVNAGARGMSLEQALEAGDVDYLVVDGSHLQEARDVFGADDLAVFGADEEGLPEDVVDLDERIAAADALPDDFDRNPGRADDLAMLIFTSGTTGMPKAARITNRRWALAALGAAAGCELAPDDTVFCVLPLYHATGMLVAVGGALVGGARLALAETFSAERFWPQVRRYGVTVVFYVGELCRYLVNQPERSHEEDHPVRLFVGNGMRPDVWEEMLERFGPVDILEFYGSTEGNVCLANFTGEKIGSVGQPLPGTDEIELVEFDAERGQPRRDDDGDAVRVGSAEPGLLLAKISDEHPLARFEGYLDDEETEKKVVRDAFEEGDAWFNTGDVLRRDEEGDYWFVDRVGETFRWSGENVSTEQVARAVRSASFCEMAVAYGVEVPGREGRAGAVAVVLEEGESFDGEGLYQVVADHLFPAARPRFVRVVDELERTSSFKFPTRRLREQGVDPAEIDDPIYLYDSERETYRPLDAGEWPPSAL